MDISEIIKKGKQAGISPEKTLQILQKNGVDISSFDSFQKPKSFSADFDDTTVPTSKERTELGKSIQNIAQGVFKSLGIGFALNQLSGAMKGMTALLSGEEAWKKYSKEGPTGLNLGYLGDMGKPMEMSSNAKEAWKQAKKAAGIVTGKQIGRAHV